MQSTATPGVGASLPAQTHIRNVIRNLAIHASIETTARSAQEVDSYVGQVPAGSDIYIAWLPETKWPHLVDLAAHVRKAGFNPVPHVAAQRLKGADDVENYLCALKAEAGVTRVLLIAGETDHKVPGFKSSLERFATKRAPIAPAGGAPGSEIDIMFIARNFGSGLSTELRRPLPTRTGLNEPRISVLTRFGECPGAISEARSSGKADCAPYPRLVWPIAGFAATSE